MEPFLSEMDILLNLKCNLCVLFSVVHMFVIVAVVLIWKEIFEISKKHSASPVCINMVDLVSGKASPNNGLFGSQPSSLIKYVIREKSTSSS